MALLAGHQNHTWCFDKHTSVYSLLFCTLLQEVFDTLLFCNPGSKEKLLHGSQLCMFPLRFR